MVWPKTGVCGPGAIVVPRQPARSLAWFLQSPPSGGDPRELGMTVMKYAGIFLPLVSVARLTLSSGCNTVEGVGRDLERAGDAIQDEADDTRDRRRRDD